VYINTGQPNLVPRVLSRVGENPGNEAAVSPCYTAVFSVVTQCSSPYRSLVPRVLSYPGENPGNEVGLTGVDIHSATLI